MCCIPCYKRVNHNSIFFCWQNYFAYDKYLHRLQLHVNLNMCFLKYFVNYV